jgi:hypothetical protein
MTTFLRLSRLGRITLPLLLLAASGSSGTAQTVGAATMDKSGGPRQLKNDPPRIIFAEPPALLIRIDGDPVYRRIEDTGLERIVNTRALIIRDSAGIHYMKVLDGWMEAYALTGDWSVSGDLPFRGTGALNRMVDATIVDVFVGGGLGAHGSSLAAKVPTIFVSTRPAALIVTNGPARYQTVEGTSLEYLANTTATVFREPTDQELYALVEGRWFRAWRTDGPWQLVPSDELPADIAKYAGHQAEGER